MTISDRRYWLTNNCLVHRKAFFFSFQSTCSTQFDGSFRGKCAETLLLFRLLQLIFWKDFLNSETSIVYWTLLNVVSIELNQHKLRVVGDWRRRTFTFWYESLLVNYLRARSSSCDAFLFFPLTVKCWWTFPIELELSSTRNHQWQ